MDWKIILSLILLLLSAVTAVVDYILDNNVLTILSIIFVVVSIVFFVCGIKSKKFKGK